MLKLLPVILSVNQLSVLKKWIDGFSSTPAQSAQMDRAGSEMIVKQSESFNLEKLNTIWPSGVTLLGVILFGSRAAAKEIHPNADWDIGVIYEGHLSGLAAPPSWDIFPWRLDHWERGFVIQLELAGSSRILFDPREIIQRRYDFLREHILPHWAGYLRRI